MPKAVYWYRVYCHLFAAFNFFLFLFSVWVAIGHESFPHDYMSSQTYLLLGLILMPLTLGMAAGNLWLVRTTSLKDPWSFHLTNIVVGLGICVFVPIALPLLVAWFQPSVREFYGRNVIRP